MNEIISLPKYKHDCKKCKFLRHETAPSRTSMRQENADLYFCSQGGINTIIARFSDIGSDYASGLNLVRTKLHNQIVSEGKKDKLKMIENIILKTNNSMEYFIFKATLISLQKNLMNLKFKKSLNSMDIETNITN